MEAVQSFSSKIYGILWRGQTSLLKLSLRTSQCYCTKWGWMLDAENQIWLVFCTIHTSQWMHNGEVVVLPPRDQSNLRERCFSEEKQSKFPRKLGFGVNSEYVQLSTEWNHWHEDEIYSSDQIIPWSTRNCLFVRKCGGFSNSPCSKRHCGRCQVWGSQSALVSQFPPLARPLECGTSSAFQALPRWRGHCQGAFTHLQKIPPSLCLYAQRNRLKDSFIFQKLKPRYIDLIVKEQVVKLPFTISPET